MVKRNLVYPFLLKCCDLIDDIFWRNIFEDLAYGYSPIGTFIYKDFLTCVLKGKECSYKITEKDPEILYNEIYSLLYDKIGILSSIQQHNKKILLDNHYTDNDNNWSTIRKKNTKEFLIEKYVLKMKDKYNLTIQQSKLLLTMIFLGIIFKTLTNKNIYYSNGEIESIDFIDFSEGEVNYTKDLISSLPEDTKIPLSSKRFVTEDWIPYIDQILTRE